MGKLVPYVEWGYGWVQGLGWCRRVVCLPLWWWCMLRVCTVYCFCSPTPFFAPKSSEVTVREWMKVTQPCPILCDPMDYIAHGILQARILEWVAFSFSRGSSQPRDWTQVSHIAGGSFTNWAIREAHQKWQLCFFSVWSFCILSLICPNCTCMQLFFIPQSCFVFRCSEDTFVHVQLLKQRVPGLSQIPACLHETLLSWSKIKTQTPTIVSEL